MGFRVPAGSVWTPPAGSDDVSPYWIGQAMLGFTHSHKFGFTKVSEERVCVCMCVNHEVCTGAARDPRFYLVSCVYLSFYRL